jgi:hypothetical protein
VPYHCDNWHITLQLVRKAMVRRLVCCNRLELALARALERIHDLADDYIIKFGTW